MTSPDAPTADMRSWVEIDRSALSRNASRLFARSGRPLIAVVKADAYGHGVEAIASQLVQWASDGTRLYALAVATLTEALELRRQFAVDKARVFCCTPLLPDELDIARGAFITPAMHRAVDIEHWCSNGGGPWQLSIDSGMQRAGVRWDDVDNLRDIVRRYPPAGVFTHFHSSERADGSREQQEQRFAQACRVLEFGDDIPRHRDNSAAIVARGASPDAWVRPGLALYGGGHCVELEVEPIATVRARIVDVHVLADGDTASYGATWSASGKRTIATLGIGYADGYRQILGNRAHALLHGRRVPVIGVVTMDMIMIDVTGQPCRVGDVATLLGRDGQETITPEELAAAGGLSVYELFIGLRLRLPRLYRDSNPVYHP